MFVNSCVLFRIDGGNFSDCVWAIPASQSLQTPVSLSHRWSINEPASHGEFQLMVICCLFDCFVALSQPLPLTPDPLRPHFTHAKVFNEFFFRNIFQLIFSFHKKAISHSLFSIVFERKEYQIFIISHLNEDAHHFHNSTYATIAVIFIIFFDVFASTSIVGVLWNTFFGSGSGALNSRGIVKASAISSCKCWYWALVWMTHANHFDSSITKPASGQNRKWIVRYNPKLTLTSSNDDQKNATSRSINHAMDQKRDTCIKEGRNSSARR